MRLETRFVPTDSGLDLLVRIYPDDIHNDSHEPALTDHERSWGEHYRLEASHGQPREGDAWAQLVNRYGPERAAWIATATAAGAEDPGRRDDMWTRAPRTAVLPNRWWALGYYGTNRILAEGQPIADPLATGPNPDPNAPVAAEPNALALDEDAMWLIDFEKAVRAGMALRISLPAGARGGLDRLIVLGVNASISAAESAERLRSLLEAHHYTRGLALVPPGTPTNNTAAMPSGFARERDAAASHLIEREKALARAGDGCGGDSVARTLGVPVGVFEHVEHADRPADDARHMNTALWRATVGYFLEHLMSEKGDSISASALDQARRHFIDHVRCGGPFPALRIGTQPYGLLPVVSLDRLKAAGPTGIDADLVQVLGVLRDAWRRSLPSVPRLGRDTADPDRDFIDVLSMEPLPALIDARPVVGPEYARHLVKLFGLPFREEYAQKNMEAVAPLKLAWAPRLARALFASRSVPLLGPLVQAGDDGAASLSPNYIQWLAGAGQEALRAESGIEPRPDTLLYLLLRHALLLEYAHAAWRIREAREALDRKTRFEAELLAVEDGAEPWTLARLLDERVTRGGDRALGRLLDPGAPAPPEAADLVETRASLQALGAKSVGELDRLARETLDACASRLDAWMTSLATKRLRAMRDQRPEGVYIGGYGWVENLRPAPPPQVVPAPAGEPAGPVNIPEESAGFVHAPSLGHAVAAAVLRSGCVSHEDAEERQALAVDLSSARVRLALWLLEGVRQGQSLGALLGYRLERGLHEAGLDRYIAPLRRLAPAVVSAAVTGGSEVDPLAARSVVDGLALHARSKDIWRELPVGAEAALRPQLEALDDAIDAIGDLGLAESIYQVVQGNPVRAGAILDAIARGESPPAEIEVVRTPRSGVGLTHRLLVLFGGAPRRDAAWPIAERHARAHAEPRLTEWVAELIGDPRRFRCSGTLRYRDPRTAAPREWPGEVTLVELGLTPLDVVLAAGGVDAPQASELEQRVQYLLRRKRPQAPADAAIELRFAETDADTASFADLQELARAIRDLLAGSRAADARDVALPEADGESEIDEVDLRRRADRAVARLRAVRLDLEQARSSGDADRMRDALMDAAMFGVSGSIPVSANGESADDLAALATQAQAVGRRLQARLDAVQQLERAPAATGRRETDRENDRNLARIEAVFGRELRVLPVFKPANAGDLASAFEASESLQGDEPWPVMTFFQRAARVRDRVARLDLVFTYADAVTRSVPMRLRVAQLPYAPRARWLALPLRTANEEPLGGRLSLVAHLRGTMSPRASLTGLVVDEWVEVIPKRRETTGVAFHYDQPGAQAPQALLLAVPVEGQQAWTRDALAETVLDALELAQLRAVDAQALAEGGHFLPALYFAFNVKGDSVSTDFKRVAATPP